MMGPRDRRGVKDKVDIESLEQENDKGLDLLADRVALLKAATNKINDEAAQQHTLLDGIDGAFASTRGLLGSVTDKFTMVMSDKNNARLVYGVGGTAAALLTLYFFMR